MIIDVRQHDGGEAVEVFLAEPVLVTHFDGVRPAWGSWARKESSAETKSRPCS